MNSLRSALSTTSKPLDSATIPPCGMYFVTPPVFKLHTLARTLKQTLQLINRWHYEKNCHVVELRMPNLSSEVVAEIGSSLLPICQEEGFSFLIHGHPAVAVSIGADGVVLGKEHAIHLDRYQKMCGPKSIIGLECGMDRSVARLALKHGADFVVFEGDHPMEMIELLHWWKTCTTTPVLVKGRAYSSHQIPHLVKAGADFMYCDLTQWDSPALLQQTVQSLMHDIEMTEEVGMSLLN